MRSLATILIVALSAALSSVKAQERADNQLVNFGYENGLSVDFGSMIEVDSTLFRLPVNHSIDPYDDATRYYQPGGSARRRGLYYTTAEQLIEPSKQYLFSIDEPLPRTQVSVYTAQSRYRYGMRAVHSCMLGSSWSFDSSLWAQTGRDLFVEGVFSNALMPRMTLSRWFDGDHHLLTIDLEANISMRGQQYGSTSEAFALVGSNYYNPAWGFYNGEVRNSRVNRQVEPSLSIHYQRPLNSITTLILEADADYSRRANSALGWYNATTPAPDYYRKMPSFMSEGEVRESVTDAWRTNNTDYTQINWDELVRLNMLSSDGDAYYTLEDKVARTVQGEVRALIATTVEDRLKLTYGIEAKRDNSRNFKQMRDLLGADYLTDYDVFISDSYNKTMPLDNNLLQPDNQITVGERFGYDYAIEHEVFNALLMAELSAGRMDFELEAIIGSESFVRQGYFEKERFAGTASYGASMLIEESPYTLRAALGYAMHAKQYFALKLVSSRLSPLSRNLFLNAMAANYLAPSTSGERINSVAVAYRLNGSMVTLSAELYALQSREGSSIISYYDDLSSTMCRASITQIGYTSVGVEAVADIRLHSKLQLTATLTAGSSYYDSNPYVELYDDYDLTQLCEATPSRMSGVKIGNTPQLSSTISASYLGISGYIVSFSSSYAALRYEQPSFVRRSERLLSQAFTNTESASAATDQQRLDDIFDVEVSLSRFFWFEQGSRLSLRLVASNLLGDNDRVSYAKESDRIILQSVDDVFTGATMRASLYQYSTPRTLRLSATYYF
ncbi:MAG: hypothetical protein SNG59_05740 [Rikenellaceae bacterium]